MQFILLKQLCSKHGYHVSLGVKDYTQQTSLHYSVFNDEAVQAWRYHVKMVEYMAR